MASRHPFGLWLGIVAAVLFGGGTRLAARESARDVLSGTIAAVEDIIEPPAGVATKTLVVSLKIVKADGLPSEADGATAEVGFQSPDRLRIVAHVDGEDYLAGRDGNQLWTDEPGKQFAVLGKPGVLRFAADPGSVDQSVLPPFKLPLTRTRISVLAYGISAELRGSRKMDGVDCHVLRLEPRSALEELLGIKSGELELWVRKSDSLPVRAIFTNANGMHVQVDVTQAKFVEPWEADVWKLNAAKDDHVDTVAVSHLVKCLGILPKMARDKIPPLPPPGDGRSVIAREGQGRLESIDGTRVLFLKGSPQEMGHQQGVLVRDEARAVAERVLYGVGVGSSFAKGSWFFGQIESAEARLEPFMDKRYLEEEDALADAAGMTSQEVRLANFFPELFHCSGFAIFGKAVSDDHIYHGRVLDYLRGIGLEQNAAVIVHQPDYGHAWVNVGYCGFIGSVTAMNDQGISIGEMGGGGYGDWDGKPMAHLIREVMEKAGSLDEAVKIMRESPRTCQYYYVIADGKAKSALGISANPKEFAVVQPGEFHPLLPHPQPDTVMMSAGQRYETLSGRVKDNYGKFDFITARKLMDPPVCMGSNIQSVLFTPDTLDLWVANADSKNVASKTRYTHYNLKQLLKPEESAEK